MSCSVEINIPDNNLLTTDKIKEEHKENGAIDNLELCDASTVVNVSLQKKEKDKITWKHKHKPGNEILDTCINNNKIKSETELEQENTDQSVDRVIKVVNWLERFHSEFHNESEKVEESERFIADNWLGENSPNPLLFTKNIRRVRVFLLEVEPNPDKEPLDLVSGYCYDGCKQFSAYTAVLWKQDDSYDVPLCPSCFKSDVKKELRLMFKVKLRVMDPQGIHGDLCVWKEHAEDLLGCSTEDYVLNPSVREAVTMPLRKYIIINTMHKGYTPLMDLNVICIRSSILVVNSRLKEINEL